ncbi:hypothetical protein PIB30_085325 [Stylosanthes scabra]|uniref:Uncharacterized protein n=1 Tax=Stylosanthes scabra TaxID=79078 RepID=A0ABU6XTE7_9FABA|nr:hypothetical protein [Stylosanthes scabra]
MESERIDDAELFNLVWLEWSLGGRTQCNSIQIYSQIERKAKKPHLQCICAYKEVEMVAPCVFFYGCSFLDLHLEMVPAPPIHSSVTVSPVLQMQKDTLLPQCFLRRK